MNNMREYCHIIVLQTSQLISWYAPWLCLYHFFTSKNNQVNSCFGLIHQPACVTKFSHKPLLMLWYIFYLPTWRQRRSRKKYSKMQLFYTALLLGFCLAVLWLSLIRNSRCQNLPNKATCQKCTIYVCTDVMKKDSGWGVFWKQSVLIVCDMIPLRAACVR